MYPHFASLAIQLTPVIVLIAGVLISLVLALYWHSVRHYNTQRLTARFVEDPEHVLLVGLLLIAVAVVVAFIALTLGLTFMGRASLPFVDIVFG